MLLLPWHGEEEEGPSSIPSSQCRGWQCERCCHLLHAGAQQQPGWHPSLCAPFTIWQQRPKTSQAGRAWSSDGCFWVDTKQASPATCTALLHLKHCLPACKFSRNGAEQRSVFLSFFKQPWGTEVSQGRAQQCSSSRGSESHTAAGWVAVLLPVLGTGIPKGCALGSPESRFREKEECTRENLTKEFLFLIQSSRPCSLN